MLSNKQNKHPFNGPFPGLPGWAGTRKVKPIWIFLKQETVSGSGTSWAVCKSAPRSRQITMPATNHSVFYRRMPFLPPNQQRQKVTVIELQMKDVNLPLLHWLSHITIWSSPSSSSLASWCISDNWHPSDDTTSYSPKQNTHNPSHIRTCLRLLPECGTGRNQTRNLWIASSMP